MVYYYFVCFIASAILTIIHLYKWKNQYGINYSLMYIFATISNFGYWQIYISTELNQAILSNKIAYVGGCFSTLSMLMCIFSMCKVRISNKVKAMFFAITCFVYGTALTVGHNEMFYKNVSLERVDGRYQMVKEYAFFHTLFYIMLVAYVIIGLVVLIIGFRKKQNVSFKSIRIMFVAMLTNFLSFFLGRALFDVELITASYVITELAVQIITDRLILYNVDQMVMESMVNSREAGIVAIDFDYNFLGCNDIAQAYYPQLDLLYVDKKIDRENEKLDELVQWIEALEKNGTFEIVYQREERYYKVTGQYLYDNNKKRGYNFVFSDYTEEKHRSEELIKVATKAKSDVLAQMSHEIRTPINAIIGMNEMVLRTTNELETSQYAKDVKGAANTLLEIVNEILDFSKIDSGKMELQCIEYNLSNLFDDVVKMFRIRAEDKGLKFYASIDSSLPNMLYGDDVKIRQILANLLSNAVKYTLEGSVELIVGGRIEDGKVKLQFRVKDTGIGIKPENRTKLFSEFERIEEKQNRGIEGTGLGMSITIRFLKMMESTLQVDSVYGEGSDFYFDLEQKQVQSETIQEYIEKQQTSLKENIYQEAFTAPEANILVVDDNKMNLKVFESILRETKMQIDKAESGEECLDLVKHKKYDLIFLDHMMPEMDGIETFHRLKQLEDSKCKDTPIIVLTANAISGAKEQYLAEGFDDYLSKPFQPDILERMIAERLPKEMIHCVEVKIVDKEDAMIENENDESLFPEIKGIDWEYGVAHFKDAKQMLETMEEFYQSMSYESDKLRNFYEELKQETFINKEIIKKYRVQVHSMKGTANLVGAVELGAFAKELEDAAKEDKVEIILNSTIEFLDEWSEYRKRLEKVFSKDDEKCIMDADIVIKLLKDLKNALEDMDIDQMDKIMQEINVFAFSDDIRKEIEKLNGIVTDLDEEKGIPMIEMLMKKIQNN